MGETISTLVFRPPPPTQLRSSNYFWLEIKDYTRNDNGSTSRVINQIPAFFIYRPGCRVTLLFSHGNAEDLGMMYPRMKVLSRVLGVNIMAYEYTGYGMSTGGPPSEAMCYKNIEAAYHYLTKVRKIPSNRIVLYGRSLGSGPSCYLAAQTAEAGNSVAGVILHSPFLSVYRVVVECGFNLVGDMFKNIDNVPKIRCPVLIIHGTKDEVVPFWHSQQLLSLLHPNCRVKPFFAPGLGHNNIEVFDKAKYTQKLIRFFEKYIAAIRGSISDQKPPLTVPPIEQPDLHELIDKYSQSQSLSSGVLCQSATIIKEVISSSGSSSSSNSNSTANNYDGESKRRTTMMNDVINKVKNSDKNNTSRLSDLPFLFPSPCSDQPNKSTTKKVKTSEDMKVNDLVESSFSYSTGETTYSSDDDNESDSYSESSQSVTHRAVRTIPNTRRRYYRSSY